MGPMVLLSCNWASEWTTGGSAMSGQQHEQFTVRSKPEFDMAVQRYMAARYRSTSND